jgi:rRNA maturation endonuclease Nob1
MIQVDKTCEWSLDENGIWETECGGMFEIVEGNPEDNDMNYCPYCGGTLRLAEY